MQMNCTTICINCWIVIDTDSYIIFFSTQLKSKNKFKNIKLVHYQLRNKLIKYKFYLY